VTRSLARPCAPRALSSGLRAAGCESRRASCCCHCFCCCCGAARSCTQQIPTLFPPRARRPLLPPAQTSGQSGQNTALASRLLRNRRPTRGPPEGDLRATRGLLWRRQLAVSAAKAACSSRWPPLARGESPAPSYSAEPLHAASERRSASERLALGWRGRQALQSARPPHWPPLGAEIPQII